MRVKSVVIENIKGVERVSFQPGALTVVRGANGSGKSSILDALRQPFAGGHDPGLIRQGAKRGSVKLELDNGATITVKITPSGSTLEITDKEGRVVPSPKKFIDQLAPVLSVDPGRLLNPALKQRDIAKELLDTIQVELSPAEVTEAIGGDWWQAMYGPQKALALTACDSEPLNVLAKVHQECYERRKLANREAKETEATETQLRRSLPDGEPGDWKAELEALHAEAQQTEQQIAAAKDAARVAMAEEISAINADIEARVDVLRKEQRERTSQARAKFDQAIATVDQISTPERERIGAAIGAAKLKVDQQQKVEITKALIAEQSEKIKRANTTALQMDLAIEKLQALKLSKLESLPIAGLTWDGAQFLVDGIAWEHVNTARKIDVVLQLAVLKAGDLRFIVLDDAEHLDVEGMEYLRAGAESLGLQVVAARVDETALTVEQVA